MGEKDRPDMRQPGRRVRAWAAIRRGTLGRKAFLMATGSERMAGSGGEAGHTGYFPPCTGPSAGVGLVGLLPQLWPGASPRALTCRGG